MSSANPRDLTPVYLAISIWKSGTMHYLSLPLSSLIRPSWGIRWVNKITQILHNRFKSLSIVLWRICQKSPGSCEAIIFPSIRSTGTLPTCSTTLLRHGGQNFNHTASLKTMDVSPQWERGQERDNFHQLNKYHRCALPIAFVQLHFPLLHTIV